MRKFIFCLVCTAALTACKDNFDMDSQHIAPKLVVSCFPSTADTTWISVSRSIPMSSSANISQAEGFAHAHIEYKVNGEPREVVQKGRAYYVAGGHHAGDHVSISTEAEGCEAVEAETTVPEAVPVSFGRIRRVQVYDPASASSENFDQVAATFTDPADSRDYYAVRIRLKHYRGWAQGQGGYLEDGTPSVSYYLSSYQQFLTYREAQQDLDWSYALTDSVYSYPSIHTASEPLLSTLSTRDYDFGYDNDFKQQFYTFSDETIQGQAYTLHLNMDVNRYRHENYSFLTLCEVQLYRLTPELYHYVKSLNEIDNNALAQAGFAMLMPTFTNIHRGIGVLAGYQVSTSPWAIYPNDL